MTYWPENIILWGAGATASLGMPTSQEQTKLITDIVNKNGQIPPELAENKNISPSLLSILQQVPFSNTGKERSVQDMWNLFSHYLRNQYSLTDKDGNIIDHDQIVMAHQELISLLVDWFRRRYADMQKKATLQSYYDFYYILARHQLELKFREYSPSSLTDRKFCLLDYAIVNFNWDMILLWVIFVAHRQLNNSNCFHVGTPAVKLKVFNDFATFLGTSPINRKAQKIWYPYNEAVQQRINDPEHSSDKRIILGKFYQPHGSFNWRECPHCGKLNMSMGNEWELFSSSFFPDEKDAECLFCGSTIPVNKMVRLLQTPFKDPNPPYIEEIQRDMIVNIENAKHIIFAGYSLPSDDLIYRSILATRHDKNVKVTVLSYEKDAKQGMSSVEDTNNQVGIQIMNVLGLPSKSIRINLEGIPNVFLTNGKADKRKILETIYWN